ncbi:MAG: hypothetical protein P8Z79_22450 [Sedimentisphaerales bacterium]|jgi:hypothetical protein
MSRCVWALMILLLSGFAFVGCRGSRMSRVGDGAKASVDVAFQIDLNKQVYQASTYGHPPQMAIWMQNRENHGIRTVMVTHRMGACDWGGQVQREVALPYWVGFYNRQTGTAGPPTKEHPAPDALTYATPKEHLIIHASVPEGSRWSYFIEVNVSGDFNAAFPKESQDGRTDRNGNGQPSLVYGGTIEAIKGTMSRSDVLGHTGQYEPVTQLVRNTEGMTTALELLKRITVSCP